MHTSTHRPVGHQIRHPVKYSLNQRVCSILPCSWHWRGNPKTSETQYGTCRWVGCRLDQFNMVGWFGLDPLDPPKDTRSKLSIVTHAQPVSAGCGAVIGPRRTTLRRRAPFSYLLSKSSSLPRQPFVIDSRSFLSSRRALNIRFVLMSVLRRLLPLLHQFNSSDQPPTS
jgi:hypothetical protein